MIDRVRNVFRSLLANQVVQATAAGIVIAWLSWPITTLMPGTGLDASWHAAINIAGWRSLDFGQDLVFTYGPLGFLAEPYLYYTVPAGLAILYVGVLHVFTAASLFWAARGSFGVLGAALIAWSITKAEVAVVPTSLVIPGLAFMWCTYAIRRGSDGWLLAVAVAGGLVGALEFLIRLNVGIVVVVMAALTVAMMRQSRLRNVTVLIASFVLSFMTLWFAAGQDTGALADYFTYSYEIVAGYSNAMGFEEAGREWEYPAAACVSALVVFVGWRSTEGWSRSDRLRLVVLGAVLAYAMFKQAFVRHDQFHAVAWFLTAAVAGVALGWRRDRKAETMLALVGIVVALLASTQPTGDQLNPVRAADSALEQAKTMLTARRFDLAKETRMNMRNYYQLEMQPVNMVNIVRGRTVHVAPYETTVAWAYPEFRWRPLPAFQSYTAYTKKLDRLDARMLASVRGPEFILRNLDPAIDGRHVSLEAPETMLSLFCRYREVTAASFWQLLVRRPNRCGRARRIGRIKARVGDEFSVPAGSREGLVLVDLYELETPLAERIRSLLFRRNALYLTVNDAMKFRLVPDTASGRLIVRIPEQLDYKGNFALSVDASSLRISGGSNQNAGSELPVDFYEIPILGPD